MIVKINPSEVVYDRKFQGFCGLAYRKHPNGCPNFGCKKDLRGIREDLKARVMRECPPTKFLINDLFDFQKDFFLIYHEHLVGFEAEERRVSNPLLKTPAQWYNSRYWQGAARSQLYKEVESFLGQNLGTVVDLSPEAHGLNLTETMKAVGVELKWGEWPPKHSLENTTYQIAFGGFPTGNFGI